MCLKYCKSSIKPPGGAYLFQALLRWGEGLNRDGSLFERKGSSFNEQERAYSGI